MVDFPVCVSNNVSTDPVSAPELANLAPVSSSDFVTDKTENTDESTGDQEESALKESSTGGITCNGDEKEEDIDN